MEIARRLTTGTRVEHVKFTEHFGTVSARQPTSNSRVIYTVHWDADNELDLNQYNIKYRRYDLKELAA